MQVSCATTVVDLNLVKTLGTNQKTKWIERNLYSMESINKESFITTVRGIKVSVTTLCSAVKIVLCIRRQC